MSAAQKLLFIRNPASGSAGGIDSESLKKRFPDSKEVFTSGPGDAVKLAREGAKSGFTPVAVGGDGTFREVAQGAQGDCEIGFVPLGTVNLIGHALKIPRGKKALDVLERARAALVYPGLCEANGEVKYFFIGVSAGPDADAVNLVNLGLKKRIGRFSYIFSLAKRLIKPVLPAVTCEIGGKSLRLGAVVALRMPFYGGPYRLGKKVSLDGMGIEVVGIESGRARLLGLFASGLMGGLPPAPAHFREMAQNMAISPDNGLMQIDGDPLHAKSASLSTAGRPILVICGL